MPERRLTVHIPCRNTRDGNTGRATREVCAGGFSRDELRTRHFGDIELEIAGHAIEDLARARRAIHGNKIQRDAVRPHVPAIEIEHAVVEAARHRQLELLRHLLSHFQIAITAGLRRRAGAGFSILRRKHRDGAQVSDTNSPFLGTAPPDRTTALNVSLRAPESSTFQVLPR